MERSEAIKVLAEISCRGCKSLETGNECMSKDSRCFEAKKMAIEALSDKGYETGYRDGWKKCLNYAVSFWKKAIEEDFEKGVSYGEK